MPDGAAADGKPVIRELEEPIRFRERGAGQGAEGGVFDGARGQVAQQDAWVDLGVGAEVDIGLCVFHVCVGLFFAEISGITLTLTLSLKGEGR